jgi:hypothetical protein
MAKQSTDEKNMKKYTIISAHFAGNGWKREQEPFRRRLASVEKDYLLVPPGLWVFRTKGASSAIEELAKALRSISVTFLRVSFDDNPPILDASEEMNQRYRNFLGE